MTAIQRLCQAGLNLLSKIAWLPPLLLRLAIGYLFFESGKGKLLDIAKPTEYFRTLGIPFPHVNAVLAGATECFGGLLVMAGLFTRAVSIPLAFVMLVAISTALWPDVHNLSDFVGLSELAYLFIFLWLATAGPGAASLDHLISKKIKTST